MIGNQFGPDISYQKSKEVKTSPSEQSSSKKSTREKVIEYFKKQGKLNKYKQEGILEEKIQLGIALEEGNKEKANKIQRNIKAMLDKNKSPSNKSQMSPLDIPKYVRRPGELTIMEDIDVNKNAAIVNQIRDIARSTGLNLRISSGHRDTDKKKYASYKKTSAHSDKSDKERAFDISHYEQYDNKDSKSGLRVVTDKEKEYIAKALRERGRRVLQEYGPIYKKGKGKFPHLHVEKDRGGASGYYSPSENKVYPTDLSNVQLEEDLTKKFLQQKKEAPVKQAMNNNINRYTDEERRKFTLNLANQGLSPSVEK